jgi:hypothetical protein
MADINYEMPIRAPAEAVANFREEFDAAWDHGGLWIGVWHPFVTGRLARLRAVAGLIEYMQKKGKVWFATMEDIAAHTRGLISSGQYKPHVDDLPYYPGPVIVDKKAAE